MTARGKRIVRWGRLLGVLFAVVTLGLTGLDTGFAQDTGSGTVGPNVDAPAVPTAVLLSSLPQGGSQARPPKAFLHSRGQALLDREKAAAELLAGLAGLIKQVAPAPGPLASVGAGFDGISSQQSFCNCYPPDGAVAVSSSYIVGAVNTAVKIWNKSGTVLAGPTSLNNFFGNKSCLPNVSDPFASYDATTDRFVLGALTYDSSNNTSMCIGVSKTNDPTGIWYIYGFPVTPSKNFLDFPHAAIGSDAIYLAGNQFQNGSSFIGARVYAYDKNAMYSAGPTTSVYYNVGSNAAGHLADSLYPVQGVGVDTTAYFLSADNCNGCSTISLWKWTSPFGSSSFGLRGGVTVTTYSQPPNARQPGFFSGRIATNDTRNLGGYWYNNTVYGTHAIGCNPGSGTVACVQWYQLGNLDTGTPTRVQQGILASNGKYRFFPNLAVDNAGNLFLGYAYSSSSDYAGIRYTGLVGGALQPEGTLKAGQTAINGGRYGDYAGTALDPINGSTIWHLEEYARSGSLWGTWVGSVCLKVSC